MNVGDKLLEPPPNGIIESLIAFVGFSHLVGVYYVCI